MFAWVGRIINVRNIYNSFLSMKYYIVIFNIQDMSSAEGTAYENAWGMKQLGIKYKDIIRTRKL